MRNVGNRLTATAPQRLKPPPKQADPFYHSPEFKAARTNALRRAGYACEKCGAQGSRLFVDHIKELKDGGDPLALSNLQCLCGSCHSKKTAVERSRRMHRA